LSRRRGSDHTFGPCRWQFPGAGSRRGLGRARPAWDRRLESSPGTIEANHFGGVPDLREALDDVEVAVLAIDANGLEEVGIAVDRRSSN
jgi:hypothetical protein